MQPHAFLLLHRQQDCADTPTNPNIVNTKRFFASKLIDSCPSAFAVEAIWESMPETEFTANKDEPAPMTPSKSTNAPASVPTVDSGTLAPNLASMLPKAPLAAPPAIEKKFKIDLDFTSQKSDPITGQAPAKSFTKSSSGPRFSANFLFPPQTPTVSAGSSALVFNSGVFAATANPAPMASSFEKSPILQSESEAERAIIKGDSESSTKRSKLSNPTKNVGTPWGPIPNGKKLPRQTAGGLPQVSGVHPETLKLFATQPTTSTPTSSAKDLESAISDFEKNNLSQEQPPTNTPMHVQKTSAPAVPKKSAVADIPKAVVHPAARQSGSGSSMSKPPQTPSTGVSSKVAPGTIDAKAATPGIGGPVDPSTQLKPNQQNLQRELQHTREKLNKCGEYLRTIKNKYDADQDEKKRLGAEVQNLEANVQKSQTKVRELEAEVRTLEEMKNKVVEYVAKQRKGYEATFKAADKATTERRKMLEEQLQSANDTIALKDNLISTLRADIRAVKAGYDAISKELAAEAQRVDTHHQKQANEIEQQANKIAELEALNHSNMVAQEKALATQRADAEKILSDERIAHAEEVRLLKAKIESFGSQESTFGGDPPAEQEVSFVTSEEDSTSVEKEQILVGLKIEALSHPKSPENRKVEAKSKSAPERPQSETQESLSVNEADHGLASLEVKNLRRFLLAYASASNTIGPEPWRQSVTPTIVDRQLPLDVPCTLLVQTTRTLERLEQSKAVLYNELFLKKRSYKQDSRNYKKMEAMADAGRRFREHVSKVVSYADAVVRLESGRACPGALPITASHQQEMDNICARLNNVSIGSHCFENCIKCQEVAREEALRKNERRDARQQRELAARTRSVRPYMPASRVLSSVLIPDNYPVIILSNDQADEKPMFISPPDGVVVTETPGYDWSGESSAPAFIPPRVNYTASSISKTQEVLPSPSVSISSSDSLTSPGARPARFVWPSPTGPAGLKKSERFVWPSPQGPAGLETPEREEFYTFKDAAKDSLYNAALCVGTFAALQVGAHVAAKVGLTK